MTTPTPPSKPAPRTPAFATHTADPTSEAAQHGEFESGSTGEAARRNWEQSRAVGQAEPVAERERKAREGYKAHPEYGATGQTDWADRKTD